MNRMKIRVYIIFILLFLIKPNTFSQDLSGRGFTYYSTYDKSKISPNSKLKKGLSLSPKIGVFTNRISAIPYQNQTSKGEIEYQDFQIGFSLGYHFIFLKKKKLSFFKKKRNEFSSLSLYFTPFFGLIDDDTPEHIINSFSPNKKPYHNSQLEFKLTYSNPSISYRGRLVSFYLLNEIGMSLSIRNKTLYIKSENQKSKLFFSLDPLKIRFGKSQLFLTTNISVALDNNPLQRKKIEANFQSGLQLYIFKQK